MRRAFLLLLVIFLLSGCSQQKEPIKEKPVSEDLEVSLIVGENYSLGEPIAFQIKTTNYSIIFSNRSGGYSVGYYPSVWICRKTNDSCLNIEYRQMKDFSKCINDQVGITVPRESFEKRDFFPSEFYGLLLRWNQQDWNEETIPCGNGSARRWSTEQVPPGNYSVTFVYWVSWDQEPRSVSADFRII